MWLGIDMVKLLFCASLARLKIAQLEFSKTNISTPIQGSSMFIVLSLSMQLVDGGDNSSLIRLSHFHLHQLTTYRL